MLIENNFASDLFKDLVYNFDKNNIRYQVMRNYELLPEDNDSKDVDILISNREKKKAKKCLLESAKRTGYKFIWFNPLDYLQGFAFAKVVDDKVYSVKIDLFTGLKWHGLNYIDTDLFLQASDNYKNIKVPAQGQKSLTMILYYVLYAKNIREKYHSVILQDFEEGKSEFLSLSKQTIGESITNDIQEALEKKDFQKIISLRSRIIKSLLKSNFSFTLIFDYIRHVKTELIDRLSFGKIIAFSGPDGVGKSTILENLVEFFMAMGLTQRKIPHHFLHESIQPIHKALPAKKELKEQDYTKPFALPPSGPFLSLIRMGYYFLAFVYNYLIIKRRELRNNGISIFDRYFTDILAIPERVRIGLHRKYIKFFYRMLPFPTLAVILVADKDIIMSRKDELTEVQLIDFLAKYKELGSYHKNVKVIENNGTAEEGILNVLSICFNHLDISNG